MDFVNNSMDGKLVLIELGVGYNTPGIIRWPFERITMKHPDAVIIRLNMDYPEVNKEILHKSLCFNKDIVKIITDLRNKIQI